jgi:hypothetical protein
MNIFLKFGLSVLLFQAMALNAMQEADVEKKETATSKNQSQCNSSQTNQTFAQKALLLQQAKNPRPQGSNIARELVGWK